MSKEIDDFLRITHGSGYGDDSGSGYGSGSGSGYGYGYGYGYGSGSGVVEFDGERVHDIDGVPTVLLRMSHGFAFG